MIWSILLLFILALNIVFVGKIDESINFRFEELSFLNNIESKGGTKCGTL